MSILVRGMQMPDSCSDCPLNHEMMLCSITRTRWWSDTMVLMDFDSREERLWNCPLVEIPEHHGRLIDADELKTAFPRCDNNMNIKIASARATINHMPTIIKAEGVDE